MAPSYMHAEASARKFGGKPEDYLAIHEFIDRTKQSFGDPAQVTYDGREFEVEFYEHD